MNVAQTIKAQVHPITECKNLINGEAFGSDSVLPVYNPATGEQIAALHEADAQIVDRAVSAAQKSFQSGVWRDLTVEERQSVLRKVAQLVDEHAETFAGLECLNTGIPYAHLLTGQIRRVALNLGFCRLYWSIRRKSLHPKSGLSDLCQARLGGSVRPSRTLERATGSDNHETGSGFGIR